MGKPEEFLLVDGYNIIFDWESLTALAAISLEDARVKLANILSDFQGSTGLTVILVFDAHKVKKNHGAIETHDNITIVYTKESETADHYIERVASRLSDGAKVRVATSDYLEQIIIISHGASRISARGLQEEINAVKKKITKNYSHNKPVNSSLLLDRVDAETAAFLENMRRQKGR